MMKYYTLIVIIVIFLVPPVVDAKASKSNNLTSSQKNNINKAVKKFERQVSTFEGNEGIQAYKKALKASISSAGLAGRDVSVVASIVVVQAAIGDIMDIIKEIKGHIEKNQAAKQRVQELLKDLYKSIDEGIENISSSLDDISKNPSTLDNDLVVQQSSTRHYGIKYCKVSNIDQFVLKHKPPPESMKMYKKKYKSKLKELNKCTESMKQNLSKLEKKHNMLKKLLSSYK